RAPPTASAASAARWRSHPTARPRSMSSAPWRPQRPARCRSRRPRCRSAAGPWSCRGWRGCRRCGPAHHGSSSRGGDAGAVAAGVRFEHGKRLIGLDEGAGGVTARFADGGTATADVVVGADGVHSTVRGLIDPDAPGPGYTGMLGFEAVVDRPVPIETGTMCFAFGKRAYYLYLRPPDRRTRFRAHLPEDRPMGLTQGRAVPAEQWLRRLREAYGQDEPGGDLVRHIEPDGLTVTGSLHIMPSVPRWYRGNVVLVGDAVHAPSNSSGQGAS